MPGVSESDRPHMAPKTRIGSPIPSDVTRYVFVLTFALYSWSVLSLRPGLTDAGVEFWVEAGAIDLYYALALFGGSVLLAWDLRRGRVLSIGIAFLTLGLFSLRVGGFYHPDWERIPGFDVMTSLCELLPINLAYA